ncbi:MAG: creatininase family protein [Ferrovibrio sp.]|uniref:creatininase family protein n=1 Tax=Ferrovibrio sp. TaxID=1917215 RepID=UPI00261A8E2F|nr:creatininase family protein [Ferrovibrio sp.]MCW0233427.1 creatininase family protein [Ferrovibrio sp.]
MTASSHPRSGFRLADLTWVDAADLIGDGLPVVIPIGAASRAHGPHLPLGTDRLVVEVVAERLLASLPVLVAPCIAQGFQPAFMDYPGSQHIEADTFQALVTEIIEGYLRHGAERILLLNNGISTEAPLKLVAQTILQRHGVRIATADLPRLGSTSASADDLDERDTSLLLAIAPALVRLDRLEQMAEDAAEDDEDGFIEGDDEPRLLSLRRPLRFTPEERAGGVLNRTGTTGDATTATAEKGERLLAAVIDEIVADLRQLWPDL